ncbi:MAG: glycine cleavage system protein H [Oligoflexia bacterium]|nr:glycine cleavage system protein H [Oligoflexia bacterium]
MAEMGEGYIPYMGHLWVTAEGEVITVGVMEEALEELDTINKIDLPTENDSVEKDEICGELETKDGSLNIYAPIEGTVLEVNSAVLDNPNLISEDPYGDGWIVKIEAANPDDIKEITSGSTSDD